MGLFLFTFIFCLLGIMAANPDVPMLHAIAGGFFIALAISINIPNDGHPGERDEEI